MNRIEPWQYVVAIAAIFFVTILYVNRTPPIGPPYSGNDAAFIYQAFPCLKTMRVLPRPPERDQTKSLPYPTTMVWFASRDSFAEVSVMLANDAARWGGGRLPPNAGDNLYQVVLPSHNVVTVWCARDIENSTPKPDLRGSEKTFVSVSIHFMKSQAYPFGGFQ